MSAPAETDDRAPSRGEARRAAIQKAAIEEFASHGLRRTSMADIARAAGISRPALYQYFRDKDEVFASAFVGLFERLSDAALAELRGPGSPTDRLDGLLQRYEGDLWEAMAASPHVDELVGAKNQQISEAIAEVVDGLWAGVADHLAEVAPGTGSADRERRAAWVDLLRYSPQGFRADEPSIDALRRRLRALATAVAADIEAA